MDILVELLRRKYIYITPALLGSADGYLVNPEQDGTFLVRLINNLTHLKRLEPALFSNEKTTEGIEMYVGEPIWVGKYITECSIDDPFYILAPR